MSYTKDHTRLMIISDLNRATEEFPVFKKEIFYFDEKLKCWATKQLEKSQSQKQAWFNKEGGDGLFFPCGCWWAVYRRYADHHPNISKKDTEKEE